MNRLDLAALIDHTLLSPEATPAEVQLLVEQAKELRVHSICISPSMLPLAADLGEVKLCTVCGFPSGKHDPALKATEARMAVAVGAEEVDMVIDLGRLRSGNLDAVRSEISGVRAEVPGLLKVIIESAALTDEEIVQACQVAVEAGADFVKTSTGFHPAGGASEHAVRLMAASVPPEVGVKASGGIRDYDTALAMVAAGATRLGCSASATILAEAPDELPPS